MFNHRVIVVFFFEDDDEICTNGDELLLAKNIQFIDCDVLPWKEQQSRPKLHLFARNPSIEVEPWCTSVAYLKTERKKRKISTEYTDFRQYTKMLTYSAGMEERLVIRHSVDISLRSTNKRTYPISYHQNVSQCFSYSSLPVINS